MYIGRVLCGAVAAGLLVSAGVAEAASIVARSVEYMALHADTVVQGEVVDQEVVLDASGTPWTRTDLSVDRRFKGEAADVVGIWQKGGPLPDGSVLVLSGDLQLEVGERALVFLDRDPDHGDRFVSFLLGWSAFEIRGQGPWAAVERSAPDLEAHAVGPDGVLLPATARKGHPRPPLTLTQLTARVVAALEVSR